MRACVLTISAQSKAAINPRPDYAATVSTQTKSHAFNFEKRKCDR